MLGLYVHWSMKFLFVPGVYEHIHNVASYSKDVPYFEVSTERNVSVVVGQTSHLNCTVRDLGDRTVSIIMLLFISYSTQFWKNKQKKKSEKIPFLIKSSLTEVFFWYILKSFLYKIYPKISLYKRKYNINWNWDEWILSLFSHHSSSQVFLQLKANTLRCDVMILMDPSNWYMFIISYNIHEPASSTVLQLLIPSRCCISWY